MDSVRVEGQVVIIKFVWRPHFADTVSRALHWREISIPQATRTRCATGYKVYY